MSRHGRLSPSWKSSLIFPCFSFRIGSSSPLNALFFTRDGVFVAQVEESAAPSSRCCSGFHVGVLAAILFWKCQREQKISRKRSLQTSAVVSFSNTSEALNSPPTVRLHHPTAQTASLSICLAEVQLDPDKGGSAPAAGEGRTPAGSFQDFKFHKKQNKKTKKKSPSCAAWSVLLPASGSDCQLTESDVLLA